VPKGKVPPPFPPHVAADIHESRQLFDLVKSQGRDGALGIVQGERALMHLEHSQGAGDGQARHPYGADSFPLPHLPEATPGDDPNVAALLKTAPANRSSRVVGDTAPAAGAGEESQA
jgi:hypothetical protein